MWPQLILDGGGYTLTLFILGNGFPGVVGGGMVFAKLGGRHAGSYRLPGDHTGSHSFDAEIRSTTPLAGCRWRRGGNERPTGHTAVVQIGQVNGTKIETYEKSPA